MVKFNQVAETLIRFSDRSPVLNGALCINQRHVHAGRCTACAEVCPLDAITLTPIPAIDPARCLACGACTAACPNDALGDPDLMLSAWRTARRAAEETGHAAFVCRATGIGPRRDQYAAAPVPCVSAVPAESYLALAAVGVEQVDLFTADCSECPLNASLIQAQKAIDTAAAALEPLGRVIKVVQQVGLPPQREAGQVGMSRRALFTSLVNRQPETHEGDSLDMMREAGVGPRRALLLEALSRISVPEDAVWAAQEQHWTDLQIANTCVSCEMCAPLCPTEALASTVQDDGTVNLWFNAARCTACGLCVRACFKHSISFTETVAPAALVSGEYVSIWQGKPPDNPLKSKVKKPLQYTT